MRAGQARRVAIKSKYSWISSDVNNTLLTNMSRKSIVFLQFRLYASSFPVPSSLPNVLHLTFDKRRVFQQAKFTPAIELSPILARHP